MSRVPAVSVALALWLSYAACVSAGPVDDTAAAYERGDYRAVMQWLRSTKDWLRLHAFMDRMKKDDVYREIARIRYDAIRADASQQVTSPPPQSQSADARPRPISPIFKADITCTVAMSFRPVSDPAGDIEVQLWSMPKGERRVAVSLPAGSSAPIISRDHLAVAVGGSVLIFDTKTGAQLRSLGPAGLQKIERLAIYFSRDGKQILAYPVASLLAVKGNPQRRVWDIQTGTELSADGIDMKTVGPDASADCPLPTEQAVLR
jgi:hypothetical protein